MLKIGNLQYFQIFRDLEILKKKTKNIIYDEVGENKNELKPFKASLV